MYIRALTIATASGLVALGVVLVVGPNIGSVALSAGIGLLILISVRDYFASRLPKIPDVEIDLSSMVSGKAGFPGETRPGYMFNFHTVSLTRHERRPIPVIHLFLDVRVGDYDARIPAGSSCQQDEPGALSIRNLTTGVLPHLLADIRLEPETPLRGHTEFVIHPQGLHEGATIETNVQITVTDVLRDRSKTIDVMTGEVRPR
jgi:hypothetical protein